MGRPLNRPPAPSLRLAVRALGAALLLSGANAGAIDLKQAYQAALKNDATYRQAQFERDAGQENAIMGRAGLLPSISASVARSKNRSDIHGSDFLGRPNFRQPVYHSSSSTISLRQAIVNFDATARFRQGLAQTNYANVQFKGRAEELIVRVATAYVEALFGRDQVALAQSQRDMYAELKRVNDRLFAQGEGARTDVLETQAKLDLAETQLIEAMNNAAAAREALALLIGSDPGELAYLVPAFGAIDAGGPVTFDEWRAIALKNNSQLGALGLAVEIAKQEIAKNRAAHAPRLDLVASYGKSVSETINTLDQDSLARSIGFQLSIPIFSGGFVNASVRQATASQQRAQAELEAHANMAMLELRKEFNAMDTGKARIAALNKAVESGALLIKATEQSIKGGVRINVDLLAAQQQQYTTLRDLAQARYDYIVSFLKLRATAGILGADDVNLLAGYFK